jgi:hypothetical protein
MPGVGIDDFGGNLIQYLPNVRYTMRRNSPLRSIGLRDIKWEGAKLVQKMHVGYNLSISDAEDGGPIPAADKQDLIEMEVARKSTVGSVQITDHLMANAKGKGTAIRVTKSELGGMMEAMRKREGHMLALDGTGTVALMGSTFSGTTFTVDDARMLWPGGWYEIRDATTTTTIHDQFQVSRVSRALTSNEATVTPVSTLASSGQAQNDLVVWQVGDYSSYNRAITGLDALIDDTATTFQGVNVATYPWWSSPVFNGGGSTQALSTGLMRQVFATLKQESEDFGDPGTGLLCLTEVWNAVTFEELFEHAVRVTPSDTKVGIPGGVTFDTAFGRITVKAMPEIKYGNMLFVNRAAIARPVQRELEWRPGGISGIFDRSDTFLGYTATCLEICDFMIFERNTCAKITNLVVAPQTAY